MSLVVMWLITEFDSFLNVMGAHYLEKVSRNVNAIALNGPKNKTTLWDILVRYLGDKCP